MHYLFLSLLVPSGLCLLFQMAATASEAKDLTSQTPAVSSPDRFWQPAHLLVQQQMHLINRIERAISEPDPNRVRAVRGQLTLHQSAVERFLNSQNPIPKFVCTPSVATPTNVSTAESNYDPRTQVYCSLYASTQRLATLAPVLNRVLSRRGEIAAVGPLPLVSGERLPDSVLPIAPIRRPNLGVPATPLVPVSNVPPPDPPLIGRTAKAAIADYVPPMQPAIAPPSEALTTLQAAKQLLSSARVAFPKGTKFIDSQEDARAIDRSTHTLYPGEQQVYSWFLSQPNTGMALVLPSSAYRPVNALQNRLAPTVAQSYPFASLVERPIQVASKSDSSSELGNTSSFTPRLALTVTDGNFKIVQSGMDYGFLVDLGNTPIENLDTQLQAVSPQTRQLFLSYQPPRALDALQVDRRRFLFGKEQDFNLSKPVLPEAPVVLNHTYLMRSLQFQMPEVIMTGERVSRRDRRYLDQLLEMQSSDIILAFRPVSRRPDGSYTVLWRVVTQLPDPKIEDLDKYVKFE